MIVGPMTVAIWPMLGPTKESSAPQTVFVVPPAGPDNEGAFEL
jgi:hypothetical protein